MKQNGQKEKLIKENNNIIKSIKKFTYKFVIIVAAIIILFISMLENVSHADADDLDKTNIESSFLSSIDMVIEILEKDKEIMDYANIMKYIYYKYTNDEAYKTELDFSAYDTSSFDNVGSNGTYKRKNIPKLVLQYIEKFEAAAKKYGIEDYLDVLLAICTQESHGYGTDIMQCGAGTVDESIDTGTRIFSENLKKSNYDLDISLQAYNFGSGYIKFAKDRGGHSKANADAFAKIHSGGKKHESGNPLGTWCYGDQNYVEHVKQYLDITENVSGDEGKTGDTYTCGNKKYYNYKQGDYSSTPPYYNATGSWGSIKDKGCMPSSISIIASGYGKKSKSGSLYTPKTIVEEVLPGRNGKATGSGVLSTYSNIVSTFKKLGLKAGSQKYTSSAGAKEDILNHLKKGNPIIVHASTGYYTGGGHFMTLLGCKDNKVYLSNPGSRSKTGYVNINILISRNVDWYVLIQEK